MQGAEDERKKVEEVRGLIRAVQYSFFVVIKPVNFLSASCALCPRLGLTSITRNISISDLSYAIAGGQYPNNALQTDRYKMLTQQGGDAEDALRGLP